MARRIPLRHRRNPPDGSTILPGASGSGSKNSSTFHRSRGTSDTASRPSRSTSPEFVRVSGTRKTRRVADDRKTRCPRHQIFDECHAVVLSSPTGGDSMPAARAASTPWSPRPRLRPLTANTPGPDHLAELPRCSAAIDRRGKFNMSGRLRSRNTSDGKYDKVPGLRGATSRNYRRVSLLARVGRRAVHRHHYRRAGEPLSPYPRMSPPVLVARVILVSLPAGRPAAWSTLEPGRKFCASGK